MKQKLIRRSGRTNPDGLLKLADPNLFGNDAGEDESPEILASYFVDNDTFASFWDADIQLRFVRARKGMGKSALLSKLAHDLALKGGDTIIVRTTGAQLAGLAQATVPSGIPNLIHYWQQAICARVNVELAKRINWPGSGDSIALVEHAELAGFREKNLIIALADRMKLTLKVGAGAVNASIERTRGTAPDHVELLSRVAASSPRVWFLVDDVDSTFVDSIAERARVSAFFSACRALATTVKGLVIRASVRTDVWSALRSNEDLDKCEQYMADLHWTSSELETILATRISAYTTRMGMQVGLAHDPRTDPTFFVGLAFRDRLAWGDAKVPAIQPVKILANRRPRWLAQLCRLAGNKAHRSHQPRIDSSSLNAVMPTFSKLRVDDLTKEHSHQFPDLPRLLEAFAGGPRRYTTSGLISRIMSRYLTRVGANTVVLNGSQAPSALEVAHFLYAIGLIAGNASKSSNFVFFEDRPELLVTTTNLDDEMGWELYPSYRNHLHIV